jgi:predicted dehydrogenase
MNFAILGDDPAVLPTLRAIVSQGRHRLTCAALCDGMTPQIRQIAPGVRILDSWAGILTADDVDAVLVSGTNESTLEGARQLASAGKSLVIFPRGDQGSTWIYELSLIRDVGAASLACVFVDRLRPEFEALRTAARTGALGRILYLRLEREIPPQHPHGDGPPLLSTNQLDDALLHDADVLRSIGGEYSRVSAVLAGSVGERVAAATATLSGDQLPEAAWTARASAHGPAWTLAIASELGEITVTPAGETPRFHVQADRIALPEVSRAEDLAFDEGTAVLNLIEHAQSSKAALGWTELVRAFEVVDAARTSVRRRRAIDLHFETTSERNIFKSQMTAAGCLVLLLTLFGVLFLLLAMPLFDLRSRVQVEAERSNAIVRLREFHSGTARLTAEGDAHVKELAPRMNGNRFPVLVEQAPQPGAADLDRRRRDAVVNALKQDGEQDAGERTQVGPIVGEWYPHLLRIVRVLAFAPLALFLLLQAMLFLTRPSAAK